MPKKLDKTPSKNYITSIQANGVDIIQANQQVRRVQRQEQLTYATYVLDYYWNNWPTSVKDNIVVNKH